MILTDSMLEAAFRFRALEPWQDLSDVDLFAVRISDGTTAYCSIMGYGGEHHSLGIYVGAEGFSTYLRTLEANSKGLFEVMSAAEVNDCINCDFMQAKDISPEVKKTIRAYAERMGLKIPRKNGWIDFTRYSPYKGQWCITDSHDALVAEEALRAATFLVSEFNEKSYAGVGLDPEGVYPTSAGGKKIPLVTLDENGAYRISSTVTPPLVKSTYVAPVFDNDILIHRLQSIRQYGNIKCRLLHIPSPVRDDDDDAEDEAPGIVGTLVLVDEKSGMLLMPFVTCDYPYNVKALLADMANHFCSLKLHPHLITVNDDKTYNLLADFCAKCGIKLRKVKNMRDMDEICMMMMHEMMM